MVAAPLAVEVVVLEDEGLSFEGDGLAPGKGSCFHLVGLVGKRLMSFAGGVGEGSGLSSFLFLGGASPAKVGAAEEASPPIIAALETDYFTECYGVYSID